MLPTAFSLEYFPWLPTNWNQKGNVMFYKNISTILSFSKQTNPPTSHLHASTKQEPYPQNEEANYGRMKFINKSWSKELFCYLKEKTLSIINSVSDANSDKMLHFLCLDSTILNAKQKEKTNEERFCKWHYLRDEIF